MPAHPTVYVIDAFGRVHNHTDHARDLSNEQI